jgi:hypothetical protein
VTTVLVITISRKAPEKPNQTASNKNFSTKLVLTNPKDYAKTIKRKKQING